MGRFLNLPDVHWREDDRLVLDSALTYTTDAGVRYIIPAGFDTDLASVPRILPGIARVLFGTNLQTAAAAILHDWLYRQALISRRQADALFYEALRADGEGRVGSFVMWAGVRLGGWFSWRSSRKHD